uniref:Uncharacterized protein n=1 Tax=uncultured prokaryote TaxID=198431 RepID=H5SCM2_9ZZZZ|nr:hypothetical protein HGMM_F11C09C16 [uncultured prokaryote]
MKGMHPQAAWINLSSHDLDVRKQAQALESVFDLYWRDVLHLLVGLAYHFPPDLTWLVQDALEGRGPETGRSTQEGAE